MPEAAVHKNGELMCAENEVGFARHQGVTVPVGDMLITKKAYQGDLGAPVSTPTDAGHDFGPLRFGKKRQASAQ